MQAVNFSFVANVNVIDISSYFVL